MNIRAFYLCALLGLSGCSREKISRSHEEQDAQFGRIYYEYNKFDKPLTWYGVFSAEDIQAHDVTIFGFAHIGEGSRIAGTTTVEGFLEGFRANFKDIVLRGSAILKDCSVNNIVVKKPEATLLTFLPMGVQDEHPEHHTITLKGNTVIEGSITFESVPGFVLKSVRGTIYLEDKARIVGKVTGAKVVQK